MAQRIQSGEDPGLAQSPTCKDRDNWEEGSGRTGVQVFGRSAGRCLVVGGLLVGLGP